MQHLQPNTTLQGGKYRIERVLGQGGFGITYLAVETTGNRQVAIKELFINRVNERVGTIIEVSNSVNDTLFEKQKKKFKKEARRIMSLDNQHIVKVYDLFEENNTVYYVMDYLEGESLASKIKREGHPLTESEVMNILPQLLDALSEIHQYQIWHLDIKPANIMLVDNNIVLIDFGASKQITPSEMTSTALYFTPGYAPAEQTGMLFKQFGPWTDLYAVGATMFNLLTGKSPLDFDIEEFKEDDLPESNLGLMYKLINWMMQPKRKERPQKAEDVKQKYYVDLVSIGVAAIAKEVLNREIVKTKGEDIDFVKDLKATKEQIDTIQREIKDLFGVDVEGYPMTHDCIIVAILQQLGWLFDYSGSDDEEEKVTDEDIEELKDLVKEQNKILEKRNEETVNEERGIGGEKKLTVEEMVALINSDNKKGLETVREIANSGNADAQLLLGIVYQMGVCGEESQSDAAYYFRMAAEQGLASAQVNLGKCYLTGDGVPEDNIKAFEWFEKAAKQSDAEGQCQLGICYQQGFGVKKDDVRAFRCFFESASQGNALGQLYLGLCYGDGTGVDKNEEEAFKWYKKSAEQDFAPAQYNLGICYLEGDGVNKNLTIAKKWFQKAAEQGDEDAQKALLYIEQQRNQNSGHTNNWNKKDSTIIDSSGHERTGVTQPYTTETLSSQPSKGTETGNGSGGNGNNSDNWIGIIIGIVVIGAVIYGVFHNNGCTNRNSTRIDTIVWDPIDTDTAGTDTADIESIGPKQELEPEPAPSAGTLKVVVDGVGVRLRIGPGTDYDYLPRSPMKGEELDYIGEEGDWYKVSYQGNYYYISKRHCYPTHSTGTRKVVVNGVGVRLRFGPGLSFDYLAWSPEKGDELDYIGEEGDWYKVSYQGNYYYISKDYSHLK